MNKEQLFAALASEVKEVEVKAINAVLRFKVMSGKARDEFHAAIAVGDKTASHFEASIVAATVVDVNDAPLFSTADIEALQMQSNSALTALAKIAMDVNNMGAEAEAAAAKN